MKNVAKEVVLKSRRWALPGHEGAAISGWEASADAGSGRDFDIAADQGMIAIAWMSLSTLKPDLRKPAPATP